jgi:hypothetical protein
MTATKIEWADYTWNPITGCSPVSEACDPAEWPEWSRVREFPKNRSVT